jgi:DNA-binding CsgD family transcriptional regulator
MRYLLILLSFCFLVASCRHTSSHDKLLLTRADSLMETHPDCALTLLKHITDSKCLSSSDHALYALLMSQAFEKCYIFIKSDSLIRIATKYYGNHNPVRAGYAWFYLARVDGNCSNAEGRASALLKAQTYATESNNHKLLGLIYSDKAREYLSQRQLDSMRQYYRLAYSTFQTDSDRRNSVVALFNVGVSYYLKSKFDSALVYFCIVEKQAVPIHEEALTSSIQRLMGVSYAFQKNYPKALFHARQSTLISDVYDYSKWYIFAMVYNQTGQLDSARFYLKKCQNPHEMAPDYDRLWQENYEKEGNFRMALYYSKKVVAAKDSLNQLSLKESFAGLEKKYNYQLISTENDKLMSKNQRQMNFILMGLLAFLSFIIFFLLFFLNKKRKELLQQQIITTQEKEKATLLEQQLQMKEMLRKKIDTFKQTALLPQKAMKESDNARQLEDALNNIDAYYKHISSRLKNQFSCLTHTEIRIVLLILVGFTSSQIAKLLCSSENTINVHRVSIHKKMKIEGKTDLIDFLFRF